MGWDNDDNSGNNSYILLKGEIKNIYYKSTDVMTPTSVRIEVDQANSDDSFDTSEDVDSDGYLTISLDSSELQYMFSIYGDLEVGDDVVWYVTATEALIQRLMHLNTKGDIMKKKKKWIKLVIILLVIAIAAGAIFVWKSHKAKAAAAAATAENTATVEKRSISSQLSSSGTLEQRILTASLPWWKVR